MSARFTLHAIWLSGPAYKVALMLSMCEQPYDYEHTHPRIEAKAPAFLAKNRYGQVPCLIDNSNGRALCQSAAILEYLADVTGRFGGATRDERLQAREWMYWEFDRLATPIYRMRGQRLGFRSIGQGVAEMYVQEGNAALKMLDDHLKGRDWIVGEHASIADIDLYGVVAYAQAGGFDLAAYPAVAGWMAHFEALPGYGSAEALMPKASRAA
jgi:glutathione S-transferase